MSRVVLIVDDSRAMRALLSRYLRKDGWSVREAVNGLQALHDIEACGLPDLMLLDWNMPVMDGYALIVELRAQERYRNLPVLMVTTETEYESLQRALAAGVNEYIMKPFDEQMLKDKLALLVADPDVHNDGFSNGLSDGAGDVRKAGAADS